MDLRFHLELGSAYKSPTQRARVLTESWVQSHIYCPNCGYPSIDRYPNNTPVGDFFCRRCREDFELKSKRDSFGTKVVDGEYRTMLKRLRGSQVPNLFTLTYDLDRGCVRDLVVIPNHFFIPAIIERRKPLAATAKRAGWIGCNILLSEIPRSGRVNIVQQGEPVEKSTVIDAWKRTLFLRQQSKLEMRGWTLDIMRCVEKLRRQEFALTNIYSFESELRRLHPNNRNIKAKIRQQLQFLRNAGYLEFIERGVYKVI